MNNWQTPGIDVIGRHNGVVGQLYDGKRLYASRGNQLLIRGGAGPFDPLTKLWARGAGAGTARLPWLGQAARAGVAAVIRTPTGAFFAVVRGALWRFMDDVWTRSWTYPAFRKPARRGICVDREGRIFVAQYTLNRDRAMPIVLWRSDDDGHTFHEVYTFAPGEVRHIHFVQVDPADGSLWMGTGDGDDECRLMRSVDGGRTFETLGAGGQRWRAIALAFLDDAVVWGTDAGRDAGDFRNLAVRFDRKTGRLDDVCPLQGPVHGVTATGGGDVWLATGLEGGANEEDDRVHVWRGVGGDDFSEVSSFPQGPQPRRVQYAITHFVTGQHSQPADAPVSLVLRGIRGMALGTLDVRPR